jgi:hypothetical protein
MRLLSRREIFAVTAETRRELIDGGFPVDAAALTSLGAHEQWMYELAARVLAISVRDPKNVELALAPLDDWRGLDDDQIAALWQQYQDHEALIDPLGAKVELDEVEVAAILAASKKKDAATLMSFGSQKLATYLLTSADPPST